MGHTNKLETEQKVIEIIAKLANLKLDQIRLEDSLTEDIHLDSFHILELLSTLEDELHFEIQADDLQPGLFLSVSSVVHYVNERLKQ